MQISISFSFPEPLLCSTRSVVSLFENEFIYYSPHVKLSLTAYLPCSTYFSSHLFFTRPNIRQCNLNPASATFPRGNGHLFACVYNHLSHPDRVAGDRNNKNSSAFSFPPFFSSHCYPVIALRPNQITETPRDQTTTKTTTTTTTTMSSSLFFASCRLILFF